MVAANRGAPARGSPRRRIPSNGFIAPAAEGTSSSYNASSGSSSPNTSLASPPPHPHPYTRRPRDISNSASHQISGVSVNSTVNHTVGQFLNGGNIIDGDSDNQSHHQTPSPSSLVAGLFKKIPSFLYEEFSTPSTHVTDQYSDQLNNANGGYEPTISLHLRSRETGSAKRQRRSPPSCNRSSWREPPADLADSISSIVARKIPSLLREREIDMSGLDKIFASAWLSDKEVVVGTKCDRLFVLDTDIMKKIQIPTFQELSTGSGRLSSPSAASFMGVNPVGATDRTHPQQAPPVNCCGIHAIAVNPSKTLLAVGSTAAIHIYHLPSFQPLCSLLGHTDMVFSVAWISEHVLISGSRDMTVKSWTLPSECTNIPPPVVTFAPNGQTILPSFPVINPTASRKEHRGKVRDLRHNPYAGQSATLSTDGFVKIWDASTLRAVSSIPLYHTQETVCMTVDTKRNLYAVGSQSHVSLLDPRSSSIVHVLESCDDTWGVRSICMERDVVTIGGGLGRISFYDARMHKYLDVESTPSARSIFMRSRSNSVSGRQPLATSVNAQIAVTTTQQSAILGDGTAPNGNSKMVSFLQTGGGYLSRDTIWQNHFQGIEIRNAVYTLAYDTSGSRLFAAGGPLQLNLSGCYAGIW
ncbi:hypothetical protein SeMB42_g04923 [Synchytrium endobioticum]|uniref:DDB1- and CUL4-associated factor 12 beta-propeller domain-containing protein n=1 Tax=Synchytrium endobioticum TaxID=286115 RepID=A0A507CV19_9FUNG|nr:hypothetical protein SeLEV6574_g07336 [Synchytrium endobioticum]TPX42965.1 hypothetical protein SeMB42_g04923 [Synchytrium endobioticum]